MNKEESAEEIEEPQTALWRPGGTRETLLHFSDRATVMVAVEDYMKYEGALRDR